MSLFGGDSALSSRQTSADTASSFSITPIASPKAAQDYDPERQVEAEDEDAAISSLESSPSGDSSSDYEVTEIDAARPNRFNGSASLWRFYTRKERQLAHSLDQLRANDLAIHLFNAHALKPRANAAGNDNASHKGRAQADRAALSDQEKSGQILSRSWTAWPLEPEDLARADSMFGAPRNGLASYSNAQQYRWDPREDLLEEVYATLLRQAKQQWDARPESGRPPGRNGRATSVGAGSRRSTSQLSTARDRKSRSPSVMHDGEDAGQPLRRSQRSMSRQRDTRSPSLAPSQPEVDPNANAIDSEAYDSEAQEQTDDESEGYTARRPVFSADDEHLHKILRPSAQHILSKLDGLLMALHHSRNGQAAYTRDSPSPGPLQSRPRTRSNPRPSHKRRMSGDRVPMIDNQQSAKRLRRTYQHDSPNAAETEFEQDDVEDPSSDETSRAIARFGLRDWSEVLGSAGLTGWDPAIIERAANRCSALFGESMAFRVMAERPQNAYLPNEGKILVGPNTSLTPGALSVDVQSTQPIVSTNSYYCPIETCKRHQKPFPFSQGYRFRDHLRRVHGYDQDEIQDLETALHLSGAIVPASRVNPREWQPPEPLCCPHSECPSAQNVFKEPRRLIDHLKKVHKYDPRKESPPPPTTPSEMKGGPQHRRRRSTSGISDVSSAATSDVRSEDEMLGGVHRDGFLETVGSHVSKRGRGREKSADVGSAQV